MRPSNIISSILLFTAVTSAWPSGWDVLDTAKREIAPLIARQDNNNNNNNDNNNNNNADTTASDAQSSTSKEGNTATSDSTSKQTGDSTITGSSSGAKNTDGTKTTDKGTDDGDKKTTEKTKYETTKTYDNRKPAGGVTMITPGPLDPSQYYKVGEYVTFAWNYTSLSQTPSAVDVLVSCSSNSAMYTIGLNQSISGATQAITWDTEKDATASIPLMVETYTLIIYDADSSPDATARAGYLGTYDQFVFGMYTPQPYTPIADFVCATCNGAMSAMERQTLGFLFGMVAVTVLSFGWFAGVAGLW